jgi:hypothetical protein
MMPLCSNDGQTWYDVPDDEFARLLAGDGDCWVDLSGPGRMLHVPLSLIRASKLPAEPLQENGLPETLYGIPVIYTEGK